jgi:peroxiredoxin
MTLKQDIDAFAVEAAGAMPAALIADIETSIEDLRASGVEARALKTGDLAPDFSLPNAAGQTRRLAELLAKGPVIVSFYRGVWCPYCSLELRAYQSLLSDIHAAGAELVAISPQTPDLSLTTAERNALAFEVLSDVGNRVSEAFGLAYATPNAVKRATATFGVDIAANNGGDDRLPISATYVIAPDRRIVLASVDADFRRRLEPQEALAVARRLAAQPVEA